MTSTWRDQPVLVTGATGLVGGAVVRRLIELEADVVCLIRDSVPQSELVRTGLVNRVKVAWGDVRDQVLLERVVGEYEVEAIIHLAAQTIIPIANRNPVSTLETNVAGTWCVLEAARRSPLRPRVVIASSDKAYGPHPDLPYDENAPLHGRHPYDVSKSCSDLVAQAYAATYDLPVAITRCGNFYGPGDLNWSRIIPGTIRAVLRGNKPIIRSDGMFTRDYFHVEDGAAAYLLLAERLATDPSVRGHAFNFSNEDPVTVVEVVQRVLAAMGSSLSPVILNEASNEIRHQWLSAEKARSVLGWKPLLTFEEGLLRTVPWYERLLGPASDGGLPSGETVS